MNRARHKGQSSSMMSQRQTSSKIYVVELWTSAYNLHEVNDLNIDAWFLHLYPSAAFWLGFCGLLSGNGLSVSGVVPFVVYRSHIGTLLI